MLETLHATRYVTPLREGGSLPAIVEANDDGLYVLKFRGAGQGKKALIAELISGELARLLGLPIPQLAFMHLDPMLGRNEPDYEIRTLIEASAGLNLAMDFLPGSITFDPTVNTIDADLASRIVWFDALIMNVDRTARNTNMLVWHKNVYLIDHGASLFFHHQWETAEGKYASPFAPVRDHVLLRYAHNLDAVSEGWKNIPWMDTLRSVIETIPDDWLIGEPHFSSIGEHRAAYLLFFEQRLASSHIFEAEAISARKNLI
ncbi:MAG TPA: HipA family kinase [Candidatus Kapabacteria bacterium]